ncbi:beta/gamma crystallin domain-containing protein [Streptomyces sp. NPDC015032]|uniref:beta/gamma crystallin domain-containing protein n=1 Tax=Streptomyces sp. NPDC015032 TaxID=3364937 RepID=UPI0036F8BFE5
MKLPVRRSLGVAAAAMAVLAATVVPATATSATTTPITAAPAATAPAMPTINRTACNEHSYVEIHNNNGKDVVCYANAGQVAVAIYGVNWVESGNNVVTFQFQKSLNNPSLESVTLKKHSTWKAGKNPVHKIISIKIH